jgi:hypothetical protein
MAPHRRAAARLHVAYAPAFALAVRAAWPLRRLLPDARGGPLRRAAIILEQERIRRAGARPRAA